MAMFDPKNDIIVDHYYCPCCLQYSPGIFPASEEDGFGDGECEMCYINLKRHNKYHFIGRCSLNEAQEFLKDPARKLDPKFDQEAYDARKNYVPIQYEDLLAENEKIRKRSGGYAVVECPYCHSKIQQRYQVSQKPSIQPCLVFLEISATSSGTVIIAARIFNCSGLPLQLCSRGFIDFSRLSTVDFFVFRKVKACKKPPPFLSFVVINIRLVCVDIHTNRDE